jgi:hypothetical protein
MTMYGGMDIQIHVLTSPLDQSSQFNVPATLSLQPLVPIA